MRADNEGLDGGCFARVGKKSQKFLVEGDCFVKFLLSFIDQTEQLKDDRR